MVQILFTVFGMGHIYENAQILQNHGTLLHTTVPIDVTLPIDFLPVLAYFGEILSQARHTVENKVKQISKVIKRSLH